VGIVKGTRAFGTLTITNEDPNYDNSFIAKYTANGGLVGVRQFRRGDFDFQNAVSLGSATSIGTNVNPVQFALHARSRTNVLHTVIGGSRSSLAADPTPAPLSADAKPRLEIFNAGQSLLFIWPAEYREFVLEATDALLPFAVWTTISAPRTEQEGSVIVLMRADGAAKFYRLRAP
jgi:hypothetical protein